MLSDEEIVDLFRNMETDRVERKRSTADGEKIREAICAFANDLPDHRKPGVVFIGQRDDGSCANIQIADATLREVAGWRTDGRIAPIPSITVRKITIDQCEVIAVVVEPSDYPPVRYEARTWIRVGPRRGTATYEEELRLAERRRFRLLPYDAQPFAAATIDDLDLRRINEDYLRYAIAPEVLAANNRSLVDQLKSLRFIAPDGPPTVAALLFFARDPQAFLPGAYIQAFRVRGTELRAENILSERRIVGTLSDQLTGCEEIFRLWNERHIVIGGEKREESPNYPEVALRQLIRNAVLHRAYEGTNSPVRLTWYDDRIEISNPGGLFGRVTPENFGSPDAVDYRNPTVAEGLRIMRFVERFGVGVALAKQACEENGNPELEYQFFPTYVHVKVGKRT
jgi:ATP-dependent DNA helicase RecG